MSAVLGATVHATGNAPVHATAQTAHVTAVVVNHDGGRWLPTVMGALAAQTRFPDCVVAVDTGSADGSAEMLAEVLPAGHLVERERTCSFPAAVAAGVAAADALGTVPTGCTRWVWILHDDCAPRADALEMLLRAAAGRPSIGVAGPKSLAWHDARLLAEVGITAGHLGRRDPRVDRGEYDQGQRDGPDGIVDSLAVGSAGMLVRRDVWDRLGGFERRLPLLGNDLDFGWRATLAGVRVVCVTDAVVRHAAATSGGRRRLDTGPRSLRRAERQAAWWLALVNLPLTTALVAAPVLLVAAVARAVGLLLTRAPGAALAETGALLALLLRPDVLLAARWRRRRTRVLPARAALPLLTPRGARLRPAVEAAVGWAVGDGITADADALAGGARHGADPDAGERSGPVRRGLLSGPVFLAAALTALALLAARDLLGPGALAGGALLPAPAGAADLWRSFTESWHPVGVGGAEPAPPYLAALAGVAALLGGSAPLAVDVLLLGCVPLAGLTAWFALSGLTSALAIRSWAALTYATLPAATGAVASGRLGTAVGVVLLPLLARAGAQALAVGWGSRAGRAGVPGWTATARAVLLLTLTAAFVPLAYVLAALLCLLAVLSGLAAWVGRRGAGRVVVRRLAVTCVVLALPPLLLAPWSLRFLDRPDLLVREPGLPGAAFVPDGVAASGALLLGHPDGAALPALAVSGGLLAAAITALLIRSRRRAAAVAAWVAALVGAATAVALTQLDVITGLAGLPAWPPVWAGFATAVAGAGYVVAAAAGAEGIRDHLRGHAFGFRHVAAIPVVLVAAAVPAIAAAAWVDTGVGAPLVRRAEPLASASAVLAGVPPASGGPAPSALVVAPEGDEVEVAVVRPGGPRLGDADLAAAHDPAVEAAAAALASGQGHEAITPLAARGIGLVAVVHRTDVAATDRVAAHLDALAALRPLGARDGVRLWRLDPARSPTTAWARLVTLRRSGAAGAAAPLPWQGDGLRVRLPAGSGPRAVVLAEPADGGWRATLDGTALPSRPWAQGRQAFVVPATGGRLVVEHDGRLRDRTLAAAGAGLLVLLLLALPGPRRATDDMRRGPFVDGAEDAGSSMGPMPATLAATPPLPAPQEAPVRTPLPTPRERPGTPSPAGVGHDGEEVHR